MSNALSTFPTSLGQNADSLVLFANSQGIEARGTLLRLTRELVVFEVYNPYSIVQLSEVLPKLRIRRAQQEVYKGRAVVSNLVNTGLIVIVSATLVDPWSDLQGLLPGEQLRQEARNFVQEWRQAHDLLSPAYQKAVTKLRNFMYDLSRWLEHGETIAGMRDPNTPDDVIDQFVCDIDQSVSPQLGDLFDEFEHQARQVSESQVLAHKAVARRELHPLMLCAPFIRRAYIKPLGYAGDYKLVRMIAQNRWGGPNTYAKLVNKLMLRSAVAEAHRRRIDMLVDYLQNESHRVARQAQAEQCFNVLNVGCGPAIEVERFLQQGSVPDCRVSMRLVDFNKQTLEYVRSVLLPHGQPVRPNLEIELVHASVHQLLKEASRPKGNATPTDAAKPKGKYDLVYCAGLFDYLSDRICGRLLRLFYDQLRPGGLVVATNVHRSNPIRAIMEHLAEWHLVLRNEQDMLVLAPSVGRQSMKTDKTGVNVFLEIRRPADTDGSL